VLLLYQFAPSLVISDIALSRLSFNQALEIIRANPDNGRCADCSTPKPDWSSINLGTMVCIEVCYVSLCHGLSSL
jgi:hypothetical protein